MQTQTKGGALRRRAQHHSTERGVGAGGSAGARRMSTGGNGNGRRVSGIEDNVGSDEDEHEVYNL